MPAVMRYCGFILVAAGISMLSGCAPSVVRHPTAALQPASDPIRVVLADAVEVQIGTGYDVRLKSGSAWQFLGSIPEGDVYKPLNQILTLEGADVHEAYMVLADGSLVGFYLPVERSFSPLSSRVALNLKQ